MALTYTALASVTVGSGGAATIDFTSIAASWTDLLLVISARDSRTTDTWSNITMRFNSDSGNNYSGRLLYGQGSSAFSVSNSAQSSILYLYANANSTTANTFSSVQIYIPNYAGSNNKSVSIDSVVEDNATNALNGLTAGLWSSSAAITSISLTPGTANFRQYSTATLYGIKNS